MNEKIKKELGEIEENLEEIERRGCPACPYYNFTFDECGYPYSGELYCDGLKRRKYEILYGE